jgi:predicted dehydrogenase
MIGLGWWGGVLMDSIHRKSEHISMILGVTVKPQEAEEAKRIYDIPVVSTIEEALAEPAVDGIVLATPPSMHRDQIVAAARAGKHVFTEKPFALSADDARVAVEACEQAGVILAVGFNRRFYPAQKKLLSLVRDGELGTILHVEGNFSHNRMGRYDPAGWRMDSRESPGGAIGLTANGIHAVDTMISLLGPVQDVTARAERRALPIEALDTVSAQLRFQSGATGHLTTLLGTPLVWRIHVFGTEGWAEVRDYHEITIRRQNDLEETHRFPDIDIERAELEAFAIAAEGRAKYPISHDEAIWGVEAFEAIACGIKRDREGRNLSQLAVAANA